MRNYNPWNLLKQARNFPSLPRAEQKEIINLMKTVDGVQGYYSSSIISELQGKIPQKDFLDIGLNFLKNGRSYLRSQRPQEIVESIKDIDENATKEVLINSKSVPIRKMILALNNISIDEEVQGLRAVSASKSVPSLIYKLKYRPRLEALEKLPPVMRLKTLESLTNIRRVKYNIFENLDEQKFKSLLFTSSLRHTDRVKSVCNKYDELKHMGKEATVTVSGNCEYCGDFSIKITSGVVRTPTGLKSTSKLKILTRQSCPFCYYRMRHAPDIVEG